ncbi:MAG: sodium:solute symporter family protein, partial [Clostridia bacterium]|nr:sodium:solute symporter family protein [Clostridia bacterium]
MRNNVLILISSLIIMGVPFIYTYYQSRKKVVTGDDWVVGGRDLPTYVIVGTQFASAMGGGVLVALVGRGYSLGLSTVTYGVIASAPFLVLMLLAPWIRQNNFTTIPDILMNFYGEHKGIAILGAFFSLIVPFGWITSQLGAFGILYSSITGIDAKFLVMAISLTSLLFIMPSGLKTVAWTDFIFACFMIAVCVICVFFGLNMAGGLDAVMSHVNVPRENVAIPGGFYSVGLSTVALWFFSVLPGGCTNQIYYQRICSIKDPKKVNKSLFLSAISLIAAILWAFLIGTIVRVLNPSLVNGEGATGWFMTQLPTWLLALFAGLVCATIMSTISSAAQTCVTNMTRDIYQRSVNPDAKDEDIVKMARILTVILMAFSCMLSIFMPDVLGWLVYTYAFSAAGLSGPIFVGYFTREKKPFTARAVLTSMIVAMVVGVIARLTGSFGTPIPFTLFGVIA